MEQPILSSGGLQASVDLDAGRGHPNGEPESRDADRSGPDWSATSEANPRLVRQSALASSRSVRIASLAAGRTIGEFLTGIRTTFAGRPVTDTRNRGLI